ncbi:MAG: prolyl oligopeptidase family serine peptidase, partial [Rhizobiaceae bacterium]|nr:prolyl oligopeptidase family serine peptidase [Rhizobiaceae bacterium]
YAEVRSFNFQNTERLFHLNDPSSKGTKEPRPMVVHLHGYRKKEASEEGKSTLEYILWDKLQDVAQKNDFIVLQPAALFGQWRLFSGLRNVTLANGLEADDRGLVFAIIQDLIAKKIADPDRIYLTGISDGAIMSYFLLCQKDSPFAAAVAIVGSMFEDHMNGCQPKYAPPLLVIAGTNDPILPYDGWIFQTGREASVPETVEFWRKKQGCTGQSTKLMDDVASDDNSRVRIVEWNGCKIEGAIKLFRVEGGGHAVPDFEPVSKSWQKRSGGQNRDISSALEAWKFLRQFKKTD